MDANFENGSLALVVLARDDGGQVKGLWFEKASFSCMLEVEDKAIFNTCAIAKDKNYLTIIIGNDCKIIVDAILGFNSYPWFVFDLLEDIKLFLGIILMYMCFELIV